MSAFLDYMRDNHILVEVEEAAAAHSSILELNNYEMEVIPQQLYEIRTLKNLYLHKNSVGNVDGKLGKLVNLKTLTLDYNEIVKLPPEIGNLRGLTILNLSHNPLKVLCKEIFMLENLRELWCNSIEIDEIPTEIASLKSLDIFGARGNNLKRLPDSITQLKSLRWLTLENNKIESLPDRMGDLDCLVHCNIRRNSLKTIPKSIEKCKKLMFFYLNGNDIESLPKGFDVKKMASIVVIDIQNNPIGKKFNPISTKIRYSSIWPIAEPREENSKDTEDQDKERGSSPDIEGIEEETWSATDDSSSEDGGRDNNDDIIEGAMINDWEHSVHTTDIDDGFQTDDENVDIGFVGAFIPELSRFAATGS